MRRTIYLVIAFGLGAILTYGVVRLYPSVRLDSQEWGVVVTTFGEGARLYGLFESKEKCSNARKAYIEDYGLIARAVTVEKGSRTVLMKEPTSGALILVTFSCLPLSEIRGLSLVTSSGDGPKGE